jgi:hypothetical protein
MMQKVAVACLLLVTVASAEGVVCPSDVSALRAAITGEVLTPADAAYSNATIQWNGQFTRHPCLVIVCNNTRDVQEGMRFAREHGMQLSARSGGHSYTGQAILDNAVALDLRRLNWVRVLPGGQEADIGPAALSGDVVRALSQEDGRGLQTSTGGCPLVALGGFLQGGGHPIIARSTGVGLDNVLGHEVVLANGTVVNTSATAHTDLYWGLRGGCGFSFGIVTNYRMRLYPECSGEGSCLGGTISYAKDDLLTVSKFFFDNAPTADPKLGLMHQGNRVQGVYNGDADAGREALKPFLNIPNTTVLSNDFQSWGNYYAAWRWGVSHNNTPPADGVLRVLTRAVFLKENLPDEDLQALIDTGHGFAMTAMGGKWSEPAANATAYPHRDFKVNFFMQPIWKNASQDAAVISSFNTSYFKHVWPNCAPNCQVYCNYPDMSLPDYAKAYWGPNLERLQILKRRFDPDEIFSFPQSIPPARDEL